MKQRTPVYITILIIVSLLFIVLYMFVQNTSFLASPYFWGTVIIASIIAMIQHSIGDLVENAKFKAGAESFPTYGSKKRVVPAGGNNLFVFAKDTEQQKAAWKFIKFLQSPESLTAWTKGTGYLPPRKGVAEDPKGLAPMIKENVMMQAAVNQLAGVRPWLSFPGKNGLQIEQVLLDAREAMLSGKQSAQEAWTQAAEKINKLLQ